MLTLLRGHRAEGACDLGSDVWRQAGFHTTREGVSMSLYVHGYAAAVPMGSERDLSGQSAEATPCGEAQVKYPCLACNAV